MSFYRGLAGAISPEVERQSAQTEVTRPLVTAAIMAGLGVLCVILSVVEALVIGPWFGPALITCVFLISVQSVVLSWPPAIILRRYAQEHRGVLAALLAAGGIAVALWALGYWPDLADGESGSIKILWVTVVGWLRYDGIFYLGWWGRALEPNPLWVPWARVCVAALIPAAAPRIIALLWRRYSIEIVAPSLANSLRARPGRVAGIYDLVEFIPDDETGASPAASARPNPPGSEL